MTADTQAALAMQVAKNFMKGSRGGKETEGMCNPGRAKAGQLVLITEKIKPERRRIYVPRLSSPPTAHRHPSTCPQVRFREP